MITLVAAGARTALIPSAVDATAVHAALMESAEAARELLGERTGSSSSTAGSCCGTAMFR